MGSLGKVTIIAGCCIVFIATLLIELHVNEWSYKTDKAVAYFTVVNVSEGAKDARLSLHYEGRYYTVKQSRCTALESNSACLQRFTSQYSFRQHDVVDFYYSYQCKKQHNNKVKNGKVYLGKPDAYDKPIYEIGIFWVGVISSAIILSIAVHEVTRVINRKRNENNLSHELGKSKPNQPQPNLSWKPNGPYIDDFEV